MAEIQPLSQLIVCPSTTELGHTLLSEIAGISSAAIQARGVFTIALSGGSLVGFLAELSTSLGESSGRKPEFDKWHVILADERCVPQIDPESNMGLLQRVVFSTMDTYNTIPQSQIYGIDETNLDNPEAVAATYETVVQNVLSKSHDQLDLAVLGFGPDGHTCSLFPGHALLKEHHKWVASILDSPKPPSKRITLTYHVLNHRTRNVIFCGAGESKVPILTQIFDSFIADSEKAQTYQVQMKQPAPFPCAAVIPNSIHENCTLSYIVDQAAVVGMTLPSI
jgi:6-phosphogluconolactonase